MELSVELLGLPDARVGRLVSCTFYNSYYNDIKTIKSVSCSYTAAGHKVTTELGLDNLSKQISAQKNIQQLKRNLRPAITYIGGAAYESAVDLD